MRSFAGHVKGSLNVTHEDFPSIFGLVGLMAFFRSFFTCPAKLLMAFFRYGHRCRVNFVAATIKNCMQFFPLFLRRWLLVSPTLTGPWVLAVCRI